MKKIKIKICCIQSIEEAQLALDHGADILGFVSEMPSGPGVIDEALIAEIIKTLPQSATSFLLTSKTTVEEIVQQQQYCRADALQLCRSLSHSQLRELKRSLPDTDLVYVVHVKGEKSVQEALEVEPLVDAILLDSSTRQNGVPQLGGTGMVHDWDVSREIVEQVSAPIYLAGGLTPMNVREAIEKVQPFGVDVCTGVRTDWKLDAKKMTAFIKEVKESIYDLQN
jgi:phosphoribosylanthranilate isomerase